MKRLYGNKEDARKEEIHSVINQHLSDYEAWLRGPGYASHGPEDTAFATKLLPMAHSQLWWVRLYVAQLLCEHKDLRDERLITILKEDRHPLVRQCIEHVMAAGAVKKAGRE
jgi:hypothetical protein